MSLIFKASLDLLTKVTQEELQTHKGALQWIYATEEYGFMHPVSNENGDDVPWDKVPEDILIEYAKKVWSDMAHEYLDSLDHYKQIYN